MTAAATAAIGVAFLFDRVGGEPPERLHPVVWLGTIIDWCDREWSRPGTVGVLVALFVPLVAGLIAAAVVAWAQLLGRLPGIVVAGTVLFTAVSLRSLVAAGTDVIAETGVDVAAAAGEARALVGRETTTLGPAALRSAAVESVAENLADGLVGPLVAFALGALVSLPVAAGAAVWVKGVNTLDSMLGYRTHPMGWASARLDDVVAWVPARLSALLLAVAAGRPGAIGTARRWAREPASPNSGWPMATMAALLDVTLVKPGAYALNPGRGLPTAEQARAGVSIVHRAGLLAFSLAGVVAWW
ncbi:MAG: adenosylcobinamide-phosphate synthase CbiB [Halobacteriota archaeon]